jgi:outer membrane protein assembly factor BamB
LGGVKRRRLLVAAGLAALALGVAIGIYVHNENQPIEKRGSAKEEFERTEPGTKRPRKLELREPWPTYAFDRERTHVAVDFDHRPPYRRLWKINAHNTLEYPPVVGYGRVYLAQQRGRFYALDSDTGYVKWWKRFRRCSASSPAIAHGVVYQAWMDFLPCPQARPGATGFVVAWDAKTGRKLWRFNGAPFESSPLIVRRTLYVGSWDHKVYALDRKTGRKRWSYETDDEVNTSAAYWRGTVYIANDSGSLYALNARTGKLRWRAGSNSKFGSREFFYATPTVAYGRVFIGNTDGTMYVYGAKSGKLRWARPLGTYVYSAAAVWRRTVYTGTYDGSFYALDAATGDVKWHRSTPGAVHAAPTVMNGVVYYATCKTCGSAASRTVKRGPNGTYALDARTGHLLWRFGAGKYANPVVADAKRIYVTGGVNLYAFKERGRKRRNAHRRR